MGWFGKSKKEQEEDEKWEEIDEAVLEIMKHNPPKQPSRSRSKKRSKPMKRCKCRK